MTRALLFLSALALGATVHAQTSASTFGLKGGLNMTNFHGDDLDNEDMRFGFHAGVFGRAAASDALGIQAELLYSTKGTRVTWNGLIDQEATIDLAYLDLPLFLVFRIGDVVELHAGGRVGYLLSSNVSTEGDLGSDTEELDRDNFNGFDAGVMGGLGINIGPAQIGARYDLGLTKLANSDAADLLLGDAKNAMAQLYIAFGLGGE